MLSHLVTFGDSSPSAASDPGSWEAWSHLFFLGPFPWEDIAKRRLHRALLSTSLPTGCFDLLGNLGPAFASFAFSCSYRRLRDDSWADFCFPGHS